MIGTGLNLRISLHASTPSRTGSMMSSTIRSGCSRCAMAMALRPSPAVTTAYPLRSKLNRSVCKIADSSSTTRIFLLNSGVFTGEIRGGLASVVVLILSYYRAVIERAVPSSGASGVELIRQPRCRHWVAHRARGVKRCSQIFAKEIHRKAVFKRARKPGLRKPLGKDVVRGRRRAEHGSHRTQIRTGPLRKHEAFGVRNHHVRDDDLVDQLDGLSHADGPDEMRRPHRPQQRLGAREDCGGCADHDRQRPFARADRTAAYRRVDELNPALNEARCEVARCDR